MRNDPLRRHGWSSSIISLEMTLVDGSTTAGDLGFSSAKSEMVSVYNYSFHDTQTNPQQNETRNSELKSNRRERLARLPPLAVSDKLVECELSVESEPASSESRSLSPDSETLAKNSSRGPLCGAECSVCSVQYMVIASVAFEIIHLHLPSTSLV